jgi:hypothetical protein
MTLPLKVYIKKKKKMSPVQTITTCLQKYCSRDFLNVVVIVYAIILIREQSAEKIPEVKLKNKYLHNIVKECAIHYHQNTHVGRQESPTHLCMVLNSARKRFFR